MQIENGKINELIDEETIEELFEEELIELSNKTKK